MLTNPMLTVNFPSPPDISQLLIGMGTGGMYTQYCVFGGMGTGRLCLNFSYSLG